MAEIDRFVFEDESGTPFTMFIESREPLNIPDAPTRSDGQRSGGSYDDDDEYDQSMGITDDVKAKLKDIHSILQAYTYYATGAFRNLAFAEVEELTIKFGIKISGTTGLPILTQGSAEGSFEIEVKCKPK
ncbi:MAG: CU044_2847 family protein [Cyanobacteria bacterium P01_F01_bin.150]